MRPSTSVKVLILALPALIFSLTANAQIHKWVDENGRVHFSDIPPESEVEVSEIASDQAEPETSAFVDPAPEEFESISEPDSAALEFIAPIEFEPLAEPELAAEIDPLGEPDVAPEIEPIADPILVEEVSPLDEVTSFAEFEPLPEPEPFTEIAPLIEPEVVIEEEPAELALDDNIQTQPEAATEPETEIAEAEPTSIDMVRCDKVRQDLILFEQNSRVRQIDPVTQERVILTEEQRTVAMQKLIDTRDVVCP